MTPEIGQLPPEGPAAAPTPGRVIGVGIARNALWNLAGTVIPGALGVAATVVMGRDLGPERFGVYVFAVFVYVSLTQLAMWGLPAALTHYVGVARGNGDLPLEDAAIAFTVRIAICGTLALAGVVAIAVALRGGPEAKPLLLAACVVLVLGPTQLLSAILVAREQFARLNLFLVTFGVVNPVVTIVVVLLGGGVIAVLLTDIATVTASVCILWVVARPVTLKSSGSRPDGYLRFASRFAVITALSVVVFQRSEVLFLRHYSTTRAVAIYGVAYGVSQLVGRLAIPLVGVASPAFARLLATDDAANTERFQRAMKVAGLFCGALAGIGWALAPTVMSLLYGSAYDAAGGPARILFLAAWAPVLSLLISAVAQGRDDLTPVIRIHLVALVVNLGLDLTTIPTYGASGAAVANSAAQIVVALLLMMQVTRWLPGATMKPLLPIVPPAAAGALASFPFASHGPWGLAAGGVAGLIAFCSVGWFTSAIDGTTIALIRSVFSRSDFKNAETYRSVSDGPTP